VSIIYGKKHIGEHFRIFPLSNWTELDVWQYIYLEDVEIPDEITKLAQDRQTAKEDKDFEKADKLRSEIEDQGYAVEDTLGGFKIKKK